MYDHILIPVAPGHFGEYERALAVAQALLGTAGKISVLTVLEELPAYVGTHIPPDQLQKQRAEVSVELKLQFQDRGIETHVVFGHSANSILDWADRHNVDCILVLSHRPGLSDFFIGSTAARIVRHAKCSVHVLR